MANHVLSTVVGRMTTMLAVAESSERTDSDLLRCFIQQRDAGAFETIVRRHGPMVLGVCRRLLHNAADAEDAFQATFIVLVRKARSLRHPERLAGWLYQVAYRVARKARQRIMRQHACQPLTVEVPIEDPVPQVVWNELRPIFDDELTQLPEKLRLPVVLCFLEGLTKREAARRLGWPEGTLSSRLQIVREALRTRLSARGLALSAAVFHVALFEGTAPAAIPSTVLTSTIQTATASALASNSAAALLAEGVMQSMFQTKLKALAAGILAIGLFGGGAGWIVGERGSTSTVYAQTGEPIRTPAAKKEPSSSTQYLWRFVDKEVAQLTATTDDEYLRRVFLDLLGRLPTAQEVRDFKKDATAEKRAKLVDWLIEDQSYEGWAKRYLDMSKAQPNRDQVNELWRRWLGVPRDQSGDDIKEEPKRTASEELLRAIGTDPAEIDALREKLKALEKQLEAEHARTRIKQAEALYLQALEEAQRSWAWKHLSETTGAAQARDQELNSKIAKLHAEIEQWRERAAWAEHMAQKGYLSKSQLQADKARLASLEVEMQSLQRQRKSARAQDAVHELEAAVQKENDAIAKGSGSEATRDRTLASLTEARIELARTRIREELEILVGVRQREVDRLTKAVEQKLIPAADLDKARQALADAKKRLADAEK